MFTLPTAVLVALLRVNETVGLVAETFPRVRLPVAPLAVRILVEPLLPASWIPAEIEEKLMGPLLAVTPTFEPKESGPTTLVKVILVAAITLPWKDRSSTCENWIEPVVEVAVEPIVISSLTVVDPEMLMDPAVKAPVD